MDLCQPYDLLADSLMLGCPNVVVTRFSKCCRLAAVVVDNVAVPAVAFVIVGRRGFSGAVQNGLEFGMCAQLDLSDLCVR